MWVEIEIANIGNDPAIEILVDGEIELEYASINGENIDYESCKLMARYFRKENKELKKYLDLVTDLLGLLSDELKEDLIVVCLLICAIDGKISLKEKRWIKQLIRE